MSSRFLLRDALWQAPCSAFLATSSHRTCWRLVAWIRGRPRDRPIALFSSYLHLKRQLGLIISHIRLSLLLGAEFCLALLCFAPVYFLTYIIFGCLLSSHTFLAVSQLGSFASISPKHPLYWESQSQVTGQFSSYACRYLPGDLTLVLFKMDAYAMYPASLSKQASSKIYQDLWASRIHSLVQLASDHSQKKTVAMESFKQV